MTEAQVSWPRELRRKVLFWHRSGPQIDYTEDGVLHMATLNPEREIEWRMDRTEMLGLGLRCILASLWKPLQQSLSGR